MKAKLYIIFVLIFTCILSSCTKAADDYIVDVSSQTDSTYEEVNPWNYMFSIEMLFDEGKNYKIYSDSQQTGFHYYVNDNNGETIDEGYHSWRGKLEFKYFNELLVLDYGFGGSEWQRRYYDVTIGSVSRFFYKPIAESKKLVAYFSTDDKTHKTVLIIQDIFNPNMFYKAVKRDFSNRITREECTGEFIDDYNLKLTYRPEENLSLITEIIDLRTAD